MQHESLEKLCNVLEEQAERQETLVAVCLSQFRAGIQGDLNYFLEKTSAMEMLVRDTIKAEAQRKSLMKKIVDEMKLSSEMKSVRRFAEQIPEPWKSRIQDACERIKISVLYLKKWMSYSIPFYKTYIDITSRTLNSLYQDNSCHHVATYGSQGCISTQPVSSVLMDSEG